MKTYTYFVSGVHQKQNGGLLYSSGEIEFDKQITDMSTIKKIQNDFERELLVDNFLILNFILLKEEDVA